MRGRTLEHTSLRYTLGPGAWTLYRCDGKAIGCKRYLLAPYIQHSGVIELNRLRTQYFLDDILNHVIHHFSATAVSQYDILLMGQW